MPLTDAQKVRLLTGLTPDELADADIDSYLELHNSGVKLAAAEALETFAGTLVDVTSDDITLSGSRRAAVLMARAQRLREQAAADDEDDSFAFDVVGGYGCGPAELAERSTW